MIDNDTRAAFTAYWQDREHTKSMLAAFGEGLNPPVELSVNDNTDEMVNECLRHCDEHGLGIAFDEEANAWKQVAAVSGTDEPTTVPAQTEQPRPQEDDAVLAALNELDAMFTLPPAHQNYLTDAAYGRSRRGKELVSRLRHELGL